MRQEIGRHSHSTIFNGISVRAQDFSSYISTHRVALVIGTVPVTICCVMASIKESMRWYMFGPVFLFGQTAVQFVITWFLARAKIRCPFRMSSVQAREPTRPALYFL